MARIQAILMAAFVCLATKSAFSELRFNGQKYSNSCGAASLSLYLEKTRGIEVSEDELLNKIGADGSKELSILDVKKMAAAYGVDLIGYRVSYKDLLNSEKLPLIVVIDANASSGSQPNSNEPKSLHFVLIEKILGDRIYLSDSKYGNTMKHLDSFRQTWVQDTTHQTGFLISERLKH